MENFVPMGTGNSRNLRSGIPAGLTWAEAVMLLRQGEFPVDLAGINEAGVAARGTPLDKASLLSDATAQAILGAGVDPKTATPDQALRALSEQLSDVAYQIGDIRVSGRDLEAETSGKYLACDGRTVKRSQYPTLVDRLGLRFGGAVEQTQRPGLPVCLKVGRYLVGYDDTHLYRISSGGTVETLVDYSGERNVSRGTVLSVANNRVFFFHPVGYDWDGGTTRWMVYIYSISMAFQVSFQISAQSTLNKVSDVVYTGGVYRFAGFRGTIGFSALWSYTLDVSGKSAAAAYSWYVYEDDTDWFEQGFIARADGIYYTGVHYDKSTDATRTYSVRRNSWTTNTPTVLLEGHKLVGFLPGGVVLVTRESDQAYRLLKANGTASGPVTYLNLTEKYMKVTSISPLNSVAAYATNMALVGLSSRSESCDALGVLNLSTGEVTIAAQLGKTTSRVERFLSGSEWVGSDLGVYAIGSAAKLPRDMTNPQVKQMEGSSYIDRYVSEILQGQNTMYIRAK